MFGVSIQGLCETFFIRSKIEGDMTNMYIVLHVNNPFFPILMKFEFSRPIFEKSQNVKFSENTYSGSRFVAFGRTDGQT